MPLQQQDLVHLRRCVTLATEALAAGEQPFGSVLVAADGQVLFEDHNRTSTGDATQHPELAIARWAAEHLDETARRRATVYTSGEHCPMCAAAHAHVGLGRIVYATSARQLADWKREAGIDAFPVAPLPIEQVAPLTPVEGPVERFVPAVHALQEQALERQARRRHSPPKGR